MDKSPFALHNISEDTAAYLGCRPTESEMVRFFHRKMGLPIGEKWSDVPSASDRLLRGKLMLEEVLEFFKGLGLEMFPTSCDENDKFTFGLEVDPSAVYDPIETADGLADIKVIANGTAVAFGIPIDDVDLEVFASNMSKLDEDGKPVVNQCKMQYANCKYQFSDVECADPSHWIDPTKPVGKLLKPLTYVPANIKGLYERETANG